MEKQSGHISLIPRAAYEELRINDATISDTEVGVAYLQARGLPVEHSFEALQTTATARNSRWLRFIMVFILGSSTEETAAALQHKAHGSLGTTIEVMAQSTSDSFRPAPTALETNEGAKERANERDTDEVDPIYAPSSSEECASNFILETDSNHKPNYETIFKWDEDNGEGGSWYCSCGEALFDGKCPYGHCGFCKSCEGEVVRDCVAMDGRFRWINTALPN